MICSAVALCCGLAACSSSQQVSAPVVHLEVEKQPLPKPTTTYGGRTSIVKPGDNLYSISFLAGFNHLDVANWNDLDADDTLQPGQVIKLYPKKEQQVAKVVVVKDRKAVTKKPVAKVKDTTVKQVKTPAVNQAKSTSSKVASKRTGSAASAWLWPVQGQVIGKFSAQRRKNGIEISGQLGSPVQVTADGKVVYAGAGLIGYGRIIIVKHDDQYLSVYAHNSRLVVREGDSVKRGQKIAEMGNTDADRVKLHFEIRKNGQPVDPLRFLPAA